MGNSAQDGGAMVNSSGGNQHHNSILNNVSFFGNHASRNGGAILSIVGSGGCRHPASNVTLVGNCGVKMVEPCLI
ncbi:MAG: hypothetical protein IPL28_21830 [Chloroflexi bacterium]|nr:hypothetical protein [Chloroflexota bacterium]